METFTAPEGSLWPTFTLADTCTPRGVLVGAMQEWNRSPDAPAVRAEVKTIQPAPGLVGHMLTLSSGECEIVVAAVVHPLHDWSTIAAAPDGGADVEPTYCTVDTLPDALRAILAHTVPGAVAQILA